MAFAFCLNKDQVLLQSAFGLLFQSLEMGSDSAVSRDDSKLLSTVMERVEANKSPGSREFRKIVEGLLKDKAPRSHRNSTDSGKASQKQKRKSLKAFTDRLTGPGDKLPASAVPGRRTTFPLTPSSSQLSRFSSSSSDTPSVYQQPSIFARSEPSLSPTHGLPGMVQPNTSRGQAVPNLDYLPFNEKAPLPLSLADEKEAAGPVDWERMLSNLDNGPMNIYDTIYGGSGAQPLNLGDYASHASSSPGVVRSSMGADALRNTSSSPQSLWTPVLESISTSQIAVPQSVLSYGSDETPLFPGEDTFESGVIASTPSDAFGSNNAMPGLNSPTLLSHNNDIDIFGSLDFGIGM
jgi:hypothetical protein